MVATTAPQIQINPHPVMKDADYNVTTEYPDQATYSDSNREANCPSSTDENVDEALLIPAPPESDDDVESYGLLTSPDGGWGWVVVFGTFMIHVLADGVAYSFGVFLEDFSDYFDASHGSTSLLSSLMIGVTWGSGPIVSALTNVFGCRIVSIVGAFVAFFGFLISLFAPNIIFMYFSFGIVSGLGLGMVYVPAIVSVTFYFEKKRAFATGLAVCGSGLGTFIFGPLTEFLLQYYGSWKAAVLIEGALLLNCAVCGALFRPLESQKPRKSNKSTKNDGEDIKLPSIDSGIELKVLTELKSTENRLRSHTTSSLPKPKDSLNFHTLQNYSSDRWLHKNSSSPTDDKAQPTSAHKRSASHFGTLSRKDIFYSGSLRNIPLYVIDRNEYTRSVMSFNDESSDPEDEAPASCWKRFCCKLNLRWKDILDFSILKDVVFILFIISNFLTSLGFCVPYVFLPDRAKLLGCTRAQGALLISVIGISNTVGRVVFGYISDRKGVNRLMLYSTVLVLCGLSTVGSSFCVNFPLLMVYAALFGCFLGSYVAITSVVLVDLLGLDKLTSSFGILLLFQGIAAVLGPPIAGSVYDATENYDMSFYLMGAMIAISGIILYPIPCIQRYKARSSEPDKHDVDMGKKVPVTSPHNQIVFLEENISM